MKKTPKKKRGLLDGYKTYDTTEGYGNAKAWRDALYERMGKSDAADMLRDQPETPYSILGIRSDATQDEIKSAFRKKITEWHPDKNPDRQKEAEAMSKKIIAAWSLLSD